MKLVMDRHLDGTVLEQPINRNHFVRIAETVYENFLSIVMWATEPKIQKDVLKIALLC